MFIHNHIGPGASSCCNQRLTGTAHEDIIDTFLISAKANNLQFSH